MLIAGYSHSLTGTDWINRTRTGLKFAGTELRSHSIWPMRTFLSHRAAENRSSCHAGMPNFFQEPLHHSPLQPKTNDAEIFYEWHHIVPPSNNVANRNSQKNQSEERTLYTASQGSASFRTSPSPGGWLIFPPDGNTIFRMEDA